MGKNVATLSTSAAGQNRTALDVVCIILLIDLFNQDNSEVYYYFEVIFHVNKIHFLFII
jgi:hypothetical protein